MNIRIRKSTPADLRFLIYLETESFPEFQRSSVRSLQRAVTSPFQDVYIAEAFGDSMVDGDLVTVNQAARDTQPLGKSEPAPGASSTGGYEPSPGTSALSSSEPAPGTTPLGKSEPAPGTPSYGNPPKPVGAAILFKYSKSLRLYSIAIAPEFRQQGHGDTLLSFIIEKARTEQYDTLVAEAHATNTPLLEWYTSRGFTVTATLHNYYAPGQDAVKLLFPLKAASAEKTHNLIVINHPHKWTFGPINARVVTVKEYISNPDYQNNPDYRVFNLCSSYKYQSYGYYVSLLASARGQRVIPTSVSIRDFRLINVIQSVASEIDELTNKVLSRETGNQFSLSVYFGQTRLRGFASLAMKLYQLFEVPLFRVDFVRNEKWIIKKLKILTLDKISGSEAEGVYEFARRYFDKKKFRSSKVTSYKYDLAILVNPDEVTPPSCSKALQKFKRAAARKGLYAELITKADFDRINEFDALFIRETTSVSNHTYEFSRMAYAEGLVVIDEPWSILRCSNKIYQNEIFRKHKLLTPQTTIFTKNLFDEKVLATMKFPLVLKQPDSAFSLGITKVETREEAITVIRELFRKSDMIVCQEFLYSDFDWRIGLIDNTPIFACKYYMSKNHWQIYNWKGEEEENFGDTETFSIDMVPQSVLRTAIKAASLIGDGLFGVDLKMINGKVYVVEVNDNPNIDAGIEDQVLGDKLYEQIIDSICRRIEISKNIRKIVVR
jgi:glutathione synthase/RimK-type ligase-like ATP-grasp enzyme/ribosomal protein S18 acetylase RimI-like enzyme